MKSLNLLLNYHCFLNIVLHLVLSQGTNPEQSFLTSGDDPEDVKARLKYWAQAVACTVKLCN